MSSDTRVRLKDATTQRRSIVTFIGLPSPACGTQRNGEAPLGPGGMLEHLRRFPFVDLLADGLLAEVVEHETWKKAQTKGPARPA